MPVGKSKPKNKGGNKKKKGASKGKARTNANNAASSSSSSSLLKGTVPNFGKRPTSIHDNHRTLYSRYKSATARFIKYMLTHTPEDVIENDRSINWLSTAAEWMEESQHTLDPIVLKDLKLCICMRSRVAKSSFGGGDAGHKFFLEVLIYCFSKLKLLPKSTVGTESEVEEGEVEENPYAVLEFDDEDDEMEEDEELFPSTPIPRPDFVERSLTLEELMSSDDRHDAVIFLFTMDELMALASHQYKALLRDIQNNRQKGYPESAMTEHLLESAVTSNFAIQQVQQLEMELQAQHEHLTTPYRLLATIAFPEITTNVSDIVKNHASKRCGKQDIIAFLGDCMECFFRNPSDRCCRRDTIVQEFNSKYDIDSVGSAEIDQLFLGIDKVVNLEVTMKPEEAQCNMLRRQLVAASGKPHDSHSWLQGMGFIGGDRAIHHTIRLLQMFGGVIESLPPGHKTELGRKGMFGRHPWIAGRSTKIRDLDELLMSDLLPAWTTMCRAGIVGRMKFPRESELSPLFMLLRSYVEAPHKPVSWSLAFGVHAMLTGILDVGKELYAITKASKATFRHFFNQVKYGADKSTNEQGMHQTKVWKHNIAMTLFLENFGVEALEEKALWNPMCAGTIFSIIGYFGNVEAGCATIDCQAQLRISLYTYHGLLINGIISEGDVIIMDILYDVFKDCKAIWPGGKLPKKGELVQFFWIVFGMSLKESKQMSEKARVLASRSARRVDPFDNDAKTLFRGRTMTPINPEDLSKSFRRICNRDFDDVKDRYHTPEQRRNARGSEQYLFAVRTNDTMMLSRRTRRCCLSTLFHYHISWNNLSAVLAVCFSGRSH